MKEWEKMYWVGWVLGAMFGISVGSGIVLYFIYYLK